MSVSKSGAHRSIRTTAVGLVVFGLAALLLPPWLPWMPASGLDPSWLFVLNHAFIHRWQFGTEIIFTFGPYGFLYGSLFYPELYGFQIVFWLLIASAIAVSTGFLLEKGAALRSPMLAPVVLISGIAILFLFFKGDPLFFSFPLLFICVFLQSDKRLHQFITIPLLAVCAFIGLIKLTFAVLGFAMVLCAEVYRFSQRKYLPVYAGAYMLFFLLFFVLAHQNIGNLGAFIAASLGVAGAYSEAMQVFRSPGEIIAFIGFTLGVLVLIAGAEWRFGLRRESDRRGSVLLLSIAIFNFMAFKAGFVRHDGHALIAWGSLVLCMTIYSTRFYQIVPALHWRFAMTVLFIAAASVSMWQFAHYTRVNPLREAGATLTRGLSERIVAIRELGLNNRFAQLSEQYRSALATIRNANPLPPIQGSVDLYPWDASLVLAHELRYAPRPVFQSYSAYSTLLIDANRAHVQGQKAPTTLLFNTQSIDGRFPGMEDGASWPDIWARYDPIDVSGDYLVLIRRAAPRMVRTVPVVTTDAPMTVPLQVPQRFGLTWVTIDVKKTVLGSVANLLFKLPILELELTMADGSTRIARILPGVASGGFVISPVIESNADFARVAVNTGVRPARSDQVVAMKIKGPKYVSWLYNKAVRVSFSEFVIDGPMERKPSPTLLSGLRVLQRSLRIVAPPAALELHPAREGGYVDGVKPAGSTISLRGWVKLGNTEKAQTITITSSIRPDSYLLKTVNRSDVALALRNEGLAQSGFWVILRFDTPASARMAAKDLCVYAQSETTPVTLVHSENQHCRRDLLN